MKNVKMAALAVSLTALASCGGGAETSDAGSPDADSKAVTDASAESAESQPSAPGGAFASCLLNDPQGDKRHFVSGVFAVDADQDAEELQAQFQTKVEASHETSELAIAPICFIAATSADVERSRNYTSGRSEERGLRKVEVEFP